ncbi:hypothetical protein R5R35_001516 [Gryllus longicercus]|uniref:Small ribosomal subunit protein uS10 domain-containing protein n=1 Tax=Gryllus longicercus TaxID=2509291 RepID=A0AAN9W5F4_9ORTH
MFGRAKWAARTYTECKKWSLCINSYRRYGIYEPDYLEAMKSKIPLYNTLNIQMRGYDFPVLENYQRFIHKIANCLDIDVEDGWATPGQKLKVQRFKPQSTVVDSEYHLTIYERNIQVTDLESTALPLLLQCVAGSLPEGVKLKIHEHQPEHEETRYVPDHELLTLKSELELMTVKKK